MAPARLILALIRIPLIRHYMSRELKRYIHAMVFIFLTPGNLSHQISAHVPDGWMGGCHLSMYCMYHLGKMEL